MPSSFYTRLSICLSLSPCAYLSMCLAVWSSVCPCTYVCAHLAQPYSVLRIAGVQKNKLKKEEADRAFVGVNMGAHDGEKKRRSGRNQDIPAIQADDAASDATTVSDHPSTKVEVWGSLEFPPPPPSPIPPPCSPGNRYMHTVFVLWCVDFSVQ